MITIIDYGVGNIFAFQNVYKRLNIPTRIAKSVNDLDNVNSDEFLSIGFVAGEETLLQDIFQVQAGEYLIFDDNKLKKEFYFDYLTKKISTKSFDELKSEFLDILRDSIQRIIKLANGRHIVLPLSGGYDSRLIASLLKQANYQNVTCFTYGKKNSPEVIISKKVANELGFKWFFVEYNEQSINQDFPTNCSSLPCVKQIQLNELIKYP